jgi:hypothetical protein
MANYGLPESFLFAPLAELIIAQGLNPVRAPAQFARFSRYLANKLRAIFEIPNMALEQCAKRFHEIVSPLPAQGPEFFLENVGMNIGVLLHAGAKTLHQFRCGI